MSLPVALSVKTRSKATDTADRVAHILALAERHGHCRVHPVGAITKGVEGMEAAPYAEMAAAGARMFSDDGKCVNNAALTRQALLEAARLGRVVAQHAQSGDLAGHGQINAGPAAEATGLPPWLGVAEETIIARDAILAAETGARLHVCHISTRRSVEIIRWPKSQGWPVTAEVTPHHLLLSDELSALTDTRYKVNPPLRRPRAQGSTSGWHFRYRRHRPCPAHGREQGTFLVRRAFGDDGSGNRAACRGRGHGTCTPRRPNKGRYAGAGHDGRHSRGRVSIRSIPGRRASKGAFPHR